RENAIGGPSDWLTLIFDTGATKTVLFEPELTERVPSARHWRSVSGLVAPTLTGSPDARIAVAPVFELEGEDTERPLRRANLDCAVITTELSNALSSAVGEPVSGLVGYSFFKRYRLAIDYPNRVLWLDPN